MGRRKKQEEKAVDPTESDVRWIRILERDRIREWRKYQYYSRQARGRTGSGYKYSARSHKAEYEKLEKQLQELYTQFPSVTPQWDPKCGDL